MNNTTLTIFPKVDIHSHLIPAIDDGCPDLDTFNNALKQIINNNVKEIVCTPHFDSILNNDTVYTNFRYISSELSKNNIKSYLGFEILLNYKNLSLLKEEVFNNKYKNLKYMLVEFERDEKLSKAEAISLIDEVMDMGFKVVLAHPEFYINYRDVKFIENLRENDVIIQCDATSFIKKKSDKKAYKFARKLLDKGLVNIVASDYHENDKRNYDNLNLSFYNIAKRCGLPTAKHLFYDNPKYVLKTFMKDQD